MTDLPILGQLLIFFLTNTSQLDYFHLSMIFKTSGLKNKNLNEKLDDTKWYLWHRELGETARNS